VKARDNPLCTDRQLAFRYRPLDCTWDDLMRRLHNLRYRCLVVGPEGSGKTTLLEDLAPRLHALGFATTFVRIDDGLPRVSAGPSAIVLLDGAEQLDRTSWNALCEQTRQSAGLVATSHTAGRLPTLIECRTSVPLLRRIVADLAPQHAALLEPLLADVYARRNGNIRLALGDLYDVLAGL